ncbi:MAG: ATP-binding protein [Chloroflexota bacterium]|nr:ATP-binding protein [Chloroflexota bacterium]
MVFNVCPTCGAWTPAKHVEPVAGVHAVAICPSCEARIPFRRLPLFVVSGASGTGKTAIALTLPSRLPECVVLESDVLWGAVPATGEDDYSTYHGVWLRLVKNIHQAGRPVVLCGTTLPHQLESHVERRYLGAIHYLALVCDASVLADRLRARPAWRDAGGDEFVARTVAFDTWIREHAATTSPAMTLLDTKSAGVAETARRVAAWVRARW